MMSIVEAAYRVELGPSDWLAGLLEVARPNLERGAGVTAYEYDASDPSRMRVAEIALLGMPTPFTREGLTRALQASDVEYVRATWRSVPCELASKTPGVENQPTWVALRAFGIVDVLGVNGIDPSGVGCWLGAPLLKRLRLGERTREAWGRVAAHVAAGLRLRRRLAGSAARTDLTSGADAVLEANGKVSHAEGEATEQSVRETLRAAAVALDRARGPLRRRAPNDALAEWQALVDARWSLIDHFDTDGRRYVVARRNEPKGATLDRLTPRERQVASYASFGHSNKLIAYELGISHSTVRVLVARAVEKLGAGTRAELMRIVVESLESTR